MTIMKRVLLEQHDISLFEQPLCPEHYEYFMVNTEDILKMLKEQTHGFWLRYVISLRSSTYQRGVIPRKDWRKILAEETYIEALQLITSNEEERAMNLRELFDDLRWVYSFNFHVTEIGVPVELCLMIPQFQPTFRRMFGRAEDLPKKFIKFIVWTRFAGGLVNVHKHWKKAKSVNSIAEIPWRAPIQWYKISKLHRVHMFEKYLKVIWGQNLSQLVDFKSPIAWWEQVEAETQIQTLLLSTIFPIHVGYLGLLLGPPESDDDDDDDDDDEGNAARGPVGFYPVRPMLSEMIHLEFLMNLISLRESVKIVCANCKIPEPVRDIYKRCKRCSEENFPVPRYYCGKTCQAEDWKKFHKREHKKKQVFPR